jgi:hypothetical protein
MTFTYLSEYSPVVLISMYIDIEWVSAVFAVQGTVLQGFSKVINVHC